MNDNQAIQMMQRCAEEITSLRAQIDRLEPKAHAYDSVATVLRLLPGPSQGYGEDIVWRLRKEIEELQPKPSAADQENDGA